MESLQNQTLNDIEIICIDDKSTDDTLKYLRKYAQNDKRIKVVAQATNNGVAAARNTGLSAATGEYIGFVDPDDYVDSDFFENLYNIAIAHNSDIAKGNVTTVEVNGYQTKRRDNTSIIQDKFNFNECFWSGIYRRHMIQTNNISFPDGQLIGEDLLFLFQAVYLANSVITTDDTSYYYCKRDGSLDSNKLSTKKLDSAILGIKRTIIWTHEQPDMTPHAYNHVLDNVYNTAFYLTQKDLSYKDQQTLCDAIIWIHDNCRDKKHIKHYQRASIAYAIIHGDRKKLHKRLFVKKTRWCIFGFIPVITINRIWDGDIRIQIFEHIPIIHIRRTVGRTHVYCIGIKILKIKY